jgi:ligand-binding sensor domain-containing protein
MKSKFPKKFLFRSCSLGLIMLFGACNVLLSSDPLSNTETPLTNSNVSHIATSTPIERLTPSPIESQNSPSPIETQFLSQTTTPELSALPIVESPLIYHSWTSYTNSNFIRALLVDQEGNLWAGGSGGVTLWNIDTGEYVKFTAENGLAGNFVTSLAQTPDGALWFGTRGSGLSRYDGISWRTYTLLDGLPGENIKSLAVAPDGSLWVNIAADELLGTPAGLVLFDGQNWTPAVGGGFDAMAVSPDGTLWAGSYSSGLGRYDGQSWELIQDIPDGRVTALSFAPNGTLWVGTETAVFRYDGSIWESFTPWEDRDGDPEVVTIATADDGVVWIGFSYAMHQVLELDREDLEEYQVGATGQPDGVFRYDGHQWQRFTSQDGLVEDEVRVIDIGPDGSIWFGSYDQGVSRFDGQTWSTYQTGESLLTNRALSLFVVEADDIWLGHPQGASHYDGQGWTTYRQLGQLEDSYVFSILVDDTHTAWFGTDSGIASNVGRDWMTITTAPEPCRSAVFEVAQVMTGGYLFACEDVAVFFDGSTWISYNEFSGRLISDIFVHPDGSWWITTANGVYSFDGDSWTHHSAANGLPENNIHTLAVDSNGFVWVSSCDGVSRFTGTGWQTDPQPAELAGCIGKLEFTSQGTAWAISDHGLLHYDGLSWILLPFQGMADRHPNDLMVADDGALWISTNAGLSRFIPPAP